MIALEYGMSSNNFGLVSFSIVFSSAQFSAVLSALWGLRLIPSLFLYIEKIDGASSVRMEKMPQPGLEPRSSSSRS